MCFQVFPVRFLRGHLLLYLRVLLQCDVPHETPGTRLAAGAPTWLTVTETLAQVLHAAQVRR